MLRYFLALTLFFSFAIPSTAKADTIFSLTNATFESGATIGGTVTINTTSGQFVSANLTYRLGNNTPALFTGPFADAGETFDSTQFFGDIYDASGDLFLIDLPVSWILHYTGGPICSDATLCDDYFGYFQSANGDVDPSTGGLLVPAAVTPEPSGLVLMVTGFSAVLGLAWRKHPRGIFGLRGISPSVL